MKFGAEFWLFFVASVSAKSCLLSAKSSPFTYVVRIKDELDMETTIGHGSLVRADKVLSTCTLFLELQEGAPLSKKYLIVGYNVDKQCAQKRRAETIKMHETCKDANNLEFPYANDFALWTVKKPFEVDEKSLPYIWGGPHPPMQSRIKSLINSLNSDPGKLKTGLFAIKGPGPELQPKAEVEFVSWSDCQTDIIVKISRELMGINLWADMFDKADRPDDRGNYTFFCGHDKRIKWNPPKDPTAQPEADWYSGAAVSIETKPGDVKSRVAIGMLSRAITTKVPGQKNFRIISGFHQGLYDFMKKSGIVPLPPTPTTTKSTTTANTKDRRNLHPENGNKNSETASQSHSAICFGVFILCFLNDMLLG